MTIYPLTYISHSALHSEASPVTQFDAELKKLIEDMYETMDHANGIGLAAPQIGIRKRIAVIDVSKERNQRLCIINPEIVSREGEALLEEGCLSVPGFYDKAPRALKVTLHAYDSDGKFFELVAEGILAHCIQHEVDHLNGKLFVDYLSPLKKQMARTKVTKFLRHQKRKK